MKNRFTVIFFILPVLLWAQTGSIKKTFPISQKSDSGRDIFKTSEGYAIFGNSVQNGSSTLSDIFMLRLDEQGTQLDLKFYGTPTSDEGIGRGIVAMPDGGWMLSGANAGQGYLLRLNANGTELWSKKFTNVASFQDLALLSNGNFLAIGGFLNNGPITVLLLSAEGNIIWQNDYALSGGLKRMIVSASGGSFFILSNLTVSKIHISNGALIWTKKIPVPDYRNNEGYTFFDINDMQSSGTGYFVLGGYLYSDQPTNLFSALYATMWSESGEQIWANYYNDKDSGFDYSTGSRLTYMPNSKNFLFTGTDVGNVSAYRIDFAGNAIDSILLGIEGYNFESIMHKIGPYYVGTGSVFSSSQSYNTFFYRSEGNAFRDEAPSNERPLSKSKVSIYPNPANESVLVDIFTDSEQVARAQWVDQMGRVVTESFASLSQGSNQIHLQVNHLAPGTYWLVFPTLNVSPVQFCRQ